MAVSKARQQPAPADDDRAATLQLIIALGRALQALERSVRPHLTQCGLGLTEFAVLEVLYHKGALPLGEIRDRILVTGASTTYVVKKLARGARDSAARVSSRRLGLSGSTPRRTVDGTLTGNGGLRTVNSASRDVG